MRPCAAAIAIVVLGSLSCERQSSSFSAEDEAAVRALADSGVHRLRSGRASDWAALYSEDGILQPPNAKTVKGRSALIAWAKALPPVENAEFTDIEIRGDGNLAYGTSGYRITLKGAPPDTGKQLWVSRRNADGKWEVIAVSFNSDLPPAPQQGGTREKK
jgi:ketosteroid isomerase-like protein